MTMFRTNAVVGGKMKHITGTFTSSDEDSQNSFTVTGVGFTPKILAVNMTSYNNIKNTPYIVCTAFTDFENGVGFTLTGNGASGQAGGYYYKSHVMTMTDNDGTYTFKNTHWFSSIDVGESGYAKYTYHIYG